MASRRRAWHCFVVRNDRRFVRKARAILAISMNDTAAAALRLETEPLCGGIELDAESRAIVAGGLCVREGALLFAAFVKRNPIEPGGVARSIELMGWQTLTMYECQHNSFHLEDEAMERGEPNEDGVPRISEADQVTLLRRGLLIARSVIDLARRPTVPVPVRCIIGANETNGNFRFHQLRAGERWNSADLDRFGLEKVVVVDSHPPR